MHPGLSIDLGLRDYREVLALQRQLVEERQQDKIPDTLLLVEHPPVLTLGRRRSSRENVIDLRFPVVEVERGGDVTYHGPGQLVAYPIFLLREDERDLHAYLRRLEQALLDTIAELGLSAARRPALTGAWIGERKLASIGIAVRRWVTLHGLALNVSTRLADFAALRPCGLDAAVMTSLEAELGRAISVDEVRPLLLRHLGRKLGRELRPAAAASPAGWAGTRAGS